MYLAAASTVPPGKVAFTVMLFCVFVSAIVAPLPVPCSGTAVAEPEPYSLAAGVEAHNENPKPYRWTKSVDEILASVKRFCRKH